MRQSNLLLHFLSMVKFVVRSFDDRWSESENSQNHPACICQPEDQSKRRQLHQRVDEPLLLLASISVTNILRHRQISLRILRYSKKCNSKFDCLIYEMFFVNELRPSLNDQCDSICAKVFFSAKNIQKSRVPDCFRVHISLFWHSSAINCCSQE